MWLPKGTSDKGARRDRGVGWLVFATAILVYVSTTGGSLTTTDAVVTYQLTQRLVEERTFALPDEPGRVARRGIDGRFYAPFGIGCFRHQVLVKRA